MIDHRSYTHKLSSCEIIVTFGAQLMRPVKIVIIRKNELFSQISSNCINRQPRKFACRRNILIVTIIDRNSFAFEGTVLH